MSHGFKHIQIIMCTTVSPFKKPTTKLQTPPPKASEANHQSLLQEKI
jgi:hypothetical protein